MHKMGFDDHLPPGSDRELRRATPAHPLELIAYFRRFRPSVLRNLLYTFIWNMGFVAVFTVLTLLYDPQVHLRACSGPISCSPTASAI